MATQKTRQSQISPSANGTKPPRHLETTPIAATDKTPKRGTAGKRSQTPKTAKASKPAAAAATTPAQAAAAKPKKTKKLSALDAAAKILAETGQAMTCPALIEAMAAKGYWTSPGGKTPAATLYSAILRELKTKGANARFKKTDRGQFAHA
jgi:hypothetical protein